MFIITIIVLLPSCDFYIAFELQSSLLLKQKGWCIWKHLKNNNQQPAGRMSSWCQGQQAL